MNSPKSQVDGVDMNNTLYSGMITPPNCVIVEEKHIFVWFLLMTIKGIISKVTNLRKKHKTCCNCKLNKKNCAAFPQDQSDVFISAHPNPGTTASRDSPHDAAGYHLKERCTSFSQPGKTTVFLKLILKWTSNKKETINQQQKIINFRLNTLYNNPNQLHQIVSITCSLLHFQTSFKNTLVIFPPLCASCPPSAWPRTPSLAAMYGIFTHRRLRRRPRDTPCTLPATVNPQRNSTKPHRLGF